ncbi:hypothetical protein AAER32_12855 [Pseudomonas aeruginosa]
MNKALDLLHGLVSEVERKTCCHEETHRGGAIWEICDSCGEKWADDEGGKPEFAWPESVEKAREFLATHPAVEQAGGDERAAFEQWLEQHMSHHISPELDLAKYEDSGEYRYNPAADYWKAWQARAALAQPSPTLPPFAEKVLAKLRRFNECAEDSDSGGVDIGRHWLDLLTQLGLLNRVQRSPALWEISQQGEDLLGLDVPEIEVPDSMIEKAWQRFERTLQQLETPGQAEQAEQAEVERPEVVAWQYRVTAGPQTGWSLWHPGKGEEFERSYTVERRPLMTVAQYERITAKLHDALDESDGDRWKMRSERDAANARLHEVATACATAEQERDAALARVAELESKLAELEMQAPVAFLYRGTDMGDQLTIIRLDHYWRPKYSTEEHDYIKGIPLYAAPVAQAQHSVPEGLAEFSQFLSAVMDAAGLVRYGRRSKELSEYLGAQCMKYRLSAPVAQAGQVPAAWYYDAPSQAEAAIIDIRGMWGEDDCPTYEDVAAALRRLLAAAPGKEVPQAWLDVQAERRRQVEVEGYHGFRDNHYISYELSKAARAYIEVSWHALSGGLPCKKPESWPWMAGFKWSDGRTMLVKACALALAEIERLDRAAPGKEGA